MDLIETSRGQVRLSARGLARAGTAGWRYRDRTSRSSDPQGSGPGCDSLRSGGLCGCVRHWCDPLGGRGFRAQSAAQQQSAAQRCGRRDRSPRTVKRPAGVALAFSSRSRRHRCSVRGSAIPSGCRRPRRRPSRAIPSDAVADAPDIPGAWTFLDLSERWTKKINDVRAKDGLRRSARTVPWPTGPGPAPGAARARR